LAQTAAVIATLAASQAALDSTGLARTFKQGRKCEANVVSVLSALVRMGYVVTTDAGRSYLLRCAA
jgi:DNA-binding IclR family transcriptional regulator